MRKINLKAKNIASNTSVSGGSSSKISLAISIVILLLAGILYGATAYLKNSQAKKITMVKTEIKALKNSLDTNKNFKTVYDFQDRLIQIDNVKKNKIKQVDVLNQLAQSTLGVDVVKNLKVTTSNGASKVNITLITPNLATVAKQINTYKGISSQNKVSLKSSSIKDGNTDMAVEFTLPRLGVESAQQSTENANYTGGQ